MRRIFCDRCKRELEHAATLGIPCHIAEYAPEWRGYFDREGNRGSGRMVEFDLCGACTNVVYEAAFKALKNL